eukprot:365325-Chlamydomonas_euryale.AAC.41
MPWADAACIEREWAYCCCPYGTWGCRGAPCSEPTCDPSALPGIDEEPASSPSSAGQSTSMMSLSSGCTDTTSVERRQCCQLLGWVHVRPRCSEAAQRARHAYQPHEPAWVHARAQFGRVHGMLPAAAPAAAAAAAHGCVPVPAGRLAWRHVARFGPAGPCCLGAPTSSGCHPAAAKKPRPRQAAEPPPALAGPAAPTAPPA